MKRYRTLIAGLCLALLGSILGIRLLAEHFIHSDELVRQMNADLPHGLTLSAQQSSLIFLPRPGLQLRDVSIADNSGPVFTAREVNLRLSFVALLKRQIGLAEISIMQPLLLLNLDTLPQEDVLPLTQTPVLGADMALVSPTSPASAPAGAAQTTPEAIFPKHTVPLLTMPAFLENTIQLPPALMGTSITLQNGSVKIAHQNAKLFSMEGLEGSFQIPGKTAGKAQLEASQLNLRLGANTLNIAGLSVNIENSLETDKPTRVNAHFFPHFAAPLQNASVQLEAHIFPESNHLPRVQGIIRLNGALSTEQPVPYSVSAPFSISHTGSMAFNGLSVQAGSDSMLVNAHIDPFSPRPQLKGQARLESLNLPYWFAFARALPMGSPSLLTSLRGTLAFTLDKESLHMEDLEIYTAGIKFYGSADIADWKTPVFHLDARTNRMNLNTLLQTVRTVPRENYGPDFSWQHTPHNTLGFDIHLSTDAALFGQQDIHNLTMRCTPEDKALMLSLRAENIYGGTASAQMRITDSIDLDFIARNLDLAALENPLKARGTLNARASLNFSAPLDDAQNLYARILQSLKGSLRLHLEQGQIPLKRVPEFFRKTLPSTPTSAFSAERLYFDMIELEGQFDSGTLQQTELFLTPDIAYTGHWKGLFKKQDFSAECSLKGTVTFSSGTGMPLKAESLTAIFLATIPPALSALPNPEDVQGTATLSFDTEKDRIRLENGNAHFAAAQWSFDSAINTRLPSLTSSLSVQSSTPQIMLAQLGLSATIPCAQLRAETSILYDQKQLAIDIQKAVLDQSTLRGSIQYAQDAWAFALNVDTIDLDRYLDTFKGQPRTNELSRKQTFQHYQLPYISGSIFVQNARIFKINHQNVQIPVFAKAQELRLSPITADVYGGQSQSALTMTLGEKPNLKMEYAVTALNMEELCKARGQSTLIAGTGQLQCSLQSLLFTENMLATLNGPWNLTIANGTVQSRNTRTPTPFQSVTASGTIKNGVLRNNNLLVRSDSMSATGAGWVNLVSETLDYTLTMTFYRISIIPLHIYGSIDDPKTSIKEFQAVKNTFENVGGGVLDLSGKVLEAPFQILDVMKKKLLP